MLQISQMCWQNLAAGVLKGLWASTHVLLLSPAVPGSARCCRPSGGLAAPSVSPELPLFLRLLALAGSAIFVYTTCRKALVTPRRGCFAALSSLSLSVLPKSLPCLLVLISLPHHFMPEHPQRWPRPHHKRKSQRAGCLGGDTQRL